MGGGWRMSVMGGEWGEWEGRRVSVMGGGWGVGEGGEG